MNLPDLRAQIEAEQAWRRDEILFFQNQGSLLALAGARDKFRRALVVLLYSHFEGFCKFALQVYVDAVNQTGISCGEANYALAAASLSDLFAALRDPNRKCDEFRNLLPDDSYLHRFARDREFIERSSRFEGRRLKVPDDIVDTESNLKPVVLRKILFRLGLNHENFKSFEGDIHKLLNCRNKIAHGESRAGVSQNDYETLRNAVFRIMDGITAQITSALAKEEFRRFGVTPDLFTGTA